MGDHIPILTYHSLDTSGSVVSVTPATFSAHMATVARLGMRGISLHDAVTYRGRHGRWPSNAVVLTFDDGYANLFDAGLPVLRAHGFGATVFVVSGHIGGANDWADPPPLLGRRAMLTADQLTAVMEAGVEIGAHTRSHPNLAGAPAARIDAELRGCRQDLEARIGCPVESFAYPYGALSEAAVRATRLVFSAACTTVLRRAGTEDLHCLPRVDMYYVRSPRLLAHTLAGRLDWYLALRRWARALRGVWA